MKTTTKVTKRAQTAIPAAIRRRYGIKGGDLLEWIDEGGVIIPGGLVLQYNNFQVIAGSNL